MIRIVLSTDATGFARNATLLASILRRSAEPLAARVYTRGFEVPSFRSGRLSVEFRRCEDEVSGRFPRHVSAAVFDRLRIISDEDEWDRVLVMDHDMVVLCDLAPYFAESFDGNLLMGRLFGPGNTLGLQMGQRGGLPPSLEHCGSFPYFFMGPMMNLAAMRQEGTWEHLLECHEAIGQDEQISLTAATGGRTKGVGKQWNLVPQWDHLEQAATSAETMSPEAVEIDGIPWKAGVPRGVIHWTGPRKPWHRGAKVWRADLWEAERTTWEVLRSGRWEKPHALEIGTDDVGGVRGLLERGWRVTVRSPEAERLSAAVAPALDLVIGGQAEAANPPDTALLRFAPGTDPVKWLEESETMPRKIVLRGPRDVVDIERVRKLGYAAGHRIDRRQWPTGGPHPDVLCYRATPGQNSLASCEDLYLSLEESSGEVPPCSGWGEPLVDRERALSEDFRHFIANKLPRLPSGSVVLVLGSIEAAVAAADSLPTVKVVAVHHDELHVREAMARHHLRDNLVIFHTPVDPVLPWYDFTELEPFEIGLLVVGAPETEGRDLRGGAPSLLPWLSHGATVVVDKRDWTGVPSLEAGWGIPEAEEEAGFLAFTANGVDAVAEAPCLPILVKRGYLVAEEGVMPGALDASRTATGIDFMGVPLKSLSGDEIRWGEMKGLEALGNESNLRGDYVGDAVSRKRALIAVLEDFLKSGDAATLVVFGKCRWKHGIRELLGKALGQLPADWDLLYLNAAKREPHLPWSPHLVKLVGARGSLAVLWRRAAAVRLIDGLRGCDCEWDVFIQSRHTELQAFCVMPLLVSLG